VHVSPHINIILRALLIDRDHIRSSRTRRTYNKWPVLLFLITYNTTIATTLIPFFDHAKCHYSNRTIYQLVQFFFFTYPLLIVCYTCHIIVYKHVHSNTYIYII